MEVTSVASRSALGTIPETWRRVPLEKLSALITKGSTPTTYGFQWETTGVLFLRSECVSEDGLDLAESMYISPAAHSFLNRSEVRDGDILITITGNVGRVIELRGIGTANINQHIARVRINASCADARYVYHFLSQASIRRYFISITTGQAYPQISLRQVRNASILIPPLREQCTIAEALSHTDELIWALQNQLQKKLDLKKASMQQLLTGSTRLPGFSNRWDERQVQDFAECVTGGTPSTSVRSYWGGAIRWMSSGELNLKRVDEVEGRITEEGLQNSPAKIIPDRCVLVGLAGQGRTRGTVAMNTVPLCTNQSIAAIIPNDAFIPEYLYYNLDYRYNELRSLSTGEGGRGGLNLNIIKSIKVPIPTRKEQAAIAEVLSCMDLELESLGRKLAKTRQLKQGMMQELLTGKTRLI